MTLPPPGEASSAASALLLQLDAQIQRLGSDVECHSGGQQEQCERELQREAEEEEEEEREVAKAKPVLERDCCG